MKSFNKKNEFLMYIKGIRNICFQHGKNNSHKATQVKISKLVGYTEKTIARLFISKPQKNLSA